MPNGNQMGDHARKFAECLIVKNSSYHNHKETMAHACVVLEIAIFGWVMSKDVWAIATETSLIWFLIVATGIWLPIHWYMRWELRFRRFATKQDAGLCRVMARWIIANPTMNELEPYMEKEQDSFSKWTLIDFFLPCFRASLPTERGSFGYPTIMVEDLKNTGSDKDRWLYFGEWLPTALSLFLFVILILRRWMDC
jgi:hypothetical protein